MSEYRGEGGSAEAYAMDTSHEERDFRTRF